MWLTLTKESDGYQVRVNMNNVIYIEADEKRSPTPTPFAKLTFYSAMHLTVKESPATIMQMMRDSK